MSFNIIGEKVMCLSYKKAEVFEEVLEHGNLFIACMTTSLARLKLYALLEKLQQRVLYFDTDSVLYTVKPHEKTLPLGNYLGELTNEIPVGYIGEFVSSGPKIYAFKVVNRKGGNYNVVKCKGFSLSARTCKKINFNSIKNMVLKADRQFAICTENPHMIIRDRKRTSLITTRACYKWYRLVYNKRVLLPDRIHTLPYGWK